MTIIVSSELPHNAFVAYKKAIERSTMSYNGARSGLINWRIAGGSVTLAKDEEYERIQSREERCSYCGVSFRAADRWCTQCGGPR